MDVDGEDEDGEDEEEDDDDESAYFAPMLLWFGWWSFVVRLAAKDGVRRMAPTALAFFFFLTFLTGGTVLADLSANWPPNGCCVPAACGTFPSRACSIA